MIFLACLLLAGRSAGAADGGGILPPDDIKPPAMLEASLTVSARVFFGDEDEEAVPLRETTVYLLDASLIDILKESGFEPESADNAEHLSGDTDYLNATAAALFSADENSLVVAFMIRKSLARHQILQKKTDTAGLARFVSLKAGSYHVFAASRMKDQIFLWTLPVALKSGANLIEIDQHNSEVIDPN